MQCQVRKPDKSEVRRRWCPEYQVPHNFDTNKWEKSTQVSEFERIETNVIAPWNPTSTDRVEDEVEQSWDGKDREKMGKNTIAWTLFRMPRCYKLCTTAHRGVVEFIEGSPSVKIVPLEIPP